MASSRVILDFLKKLSDPDADIRIIALNDILNELNKPYLQIDDATEVTIVRDILNAVKASNSEVKNAAVKTLGKLVSVVQEQHMITIIDRLMEYSSSDDEQLRDISNLGQRTVIAELNPLSPIGTSATLKLVPQLVKQLKENSQNEDILISASDLLSTMLSRFDNLLSENFEILQNILDALTPLIPYRYAIRKRATEGLAHWASIATPELLETFYNQTMLPYLDSTQLPELRAGVYLTGAVINRAPHRINKKLNIIIPKVLSAAEHDDDELTETCLHTLERAIFKCPRDSAPSLRTIVDLALKLLKHDPNYAAMDEDDLEDDEDEEDDDTFDDDEYDDDEDMSWKVRNASAKVLKAVLDTKPDDLNGYYKIISPVLISSFSEREEHVRMEIWEVMIKLLTLLQTIPEATVYRSDSPGSLKRKRPMDVDDSPVTILRGQVAQIVTIMTKQLGIKKNNLRENGFLLLHTLVDALHGGLEEHFAALSPQIIDGISSAESLSSGSSTTLKMQILSFLGSVFITHSPFTYESQLPQLLPQLVASLKENVNKVSSQAFKTCSLLIQALRPIAEKTTEIPSITPSFVDPIQQITSTTLEQLNSANVDQEVKKFGILCLSELLYHAGDIIDSSSSLGLLQDLLNREVTRLSSVQAITKAAKSPSLKGQFVDNWFQTIMGGVSELLRQSDRILRDEVFTCLPALFKRIGASAPMAGIEQILNNVVLFITPNEKHFLPFALNTIKCALEANQQILNTEILQNKILPLVYSLVNSRDVAGATVICDNILAFFGVLISAGADPSQTITSLTAAVGVDKDDAHIDYDTYCYATAARTIGLVASLVTNVIIPTSEQLLAAIQDQKTPKSRLVFSLMTLGELGRLPDFPSPETYFGVADQFFNSSNADVRTAASFAVGNLAVGAHEKLVPNILKQIEANQENIANCELSLLALKEFITHTTSETLTKYADTLWTSLFNLCSVDAPPLSGTLDQNNDDSNSIEQNDKQRKDYKSTETIRNIAADCLGKITVNDPVKFLPFLHERTHDKLSGIRAVVVKAARYALYSDSSAVEDTLTSIATKFIVVLHDSDLDVRRSALATLNTCAHNKPYILRANFGLFLEALYEETVINESLIRLLKVGPFKHKHDDGLECRKTAYETLYTLLATSPTKIDTYEYINHIIRGLGDDNEIRIICYLTLVRLADVAPNCVIQRLDEIADIFMKLLNEKPLESAQKPDVEKLLQIQKACLRCFAGISKLSSPTITPKFAASVNQIKIHSSYRQEFEELQRSSIAVKQTDNNNMELD